MPSVLVNGTKILSIKFRKLKIIDSYSFLSMPLSDFSITFNLNESKGHFPHLFNLPENQNYIGAYPDRKFYGSEFFASKKKAEFNNWYDSVKHETFDFKQQFLDYCWSDVVLLADGCLAFRKIIMERTKLDENNYGIDPFLSSIKIASLCHHIFRSKIMKPETIGINWY
ncbi:unnamed protein product [Brachionus calyciflorus]|uniref:DNA-directed DNA polymerase n=1 Tax=Brachionus calyciflorus TaxID=104777 RepID=A0A814LWM7_9BILA|nr:unnamed protein product [Brachionus calyciflorus]